MAFFEDAERLEDASHDPGDGGLAGAGVAGEDAVIGDRGNFESLRFAGLHDFGVIHQLMDLGLDFPQTDHAVQFAQHLLHGNFLLFDDRFGRDHIGGGQAHQLFLG